jgi:hypothetical protein
MPGLGLAHHINVGFVLQEPAHSLTGQRLVIHDQDSHSFHLPSR